MVVLRTDGSRLRGFSHDFVPGRSGFHLQEVDPGGEPARTCTVDLRDVHAVFFVRDFGFKRERRYTADTAPRSVTDPPVTGAKRLKITFVWGEVMEGLSYGYDPNRPGFFLFPTEPRERAYNLERAFVTRDAIREVQLQPAA